MCSNLTKVKKCANFFGFSYHSTMVKAVGVTKKATKRSTQNAFTPSITSLTDMNDDCLVHVFEHLDIISLIKVCKSNQRFKQIVLERVIPFKTVDFATFSKCYSVEKVFKLFGKSMTRIAINSSDIQMTAVSTGSLRFAEFLRLLVKYGEPGQLQQVKLDFGVNHCVPTFVQLLDAVCPYFVNVHSISFNLSANSEWFDKFMVAIPKQNLRSLNVENMRTVGDWLTAESLPNLRSIHLRLSRDQHFQAHRNQLDMIIESKIMAFISSKPPSLVEFGVVGIPHETIYRGLSHSLPDIERLGWIKCWEDNMNSNRNNVRHPRNYYNDKWEYFNAFTNLKSLKLESTATDCSDCGEVFRILASRNTIRELDLNSTCNYIRRENSVSVADIKRLDKLTTLKYTQSYYNTNSGDKTGEFLNTLLVNLPALRKCTLQGPRINQSQIINIVQSARGLRVLVIDCVIIFTALLYKKLLKLRNASYPNSEENRLIIYVDHEKYTKCVADLGKKYKPAIITLKSL